MGAGKQSIAEIELIDNALYSSSTLVTRPSSSKVVEGADISRPFVIARSPRRLKQSRRKGVTMRLLRFARNDIKKRNDIKNYPRCHLSI